MEWHRRKENEIEAGQERAPVLYVRRVFYEPLNINLWFLIIGWGLTWMERKFRGDKGWPLLVQKGGVPSGHVGNPATQSYIAYAKTYIPKYFANPHPHSSKNCTLGVIWQCFMKLGQMKIYTT